MGRSVVVSGAFALTLWGATASAAAPQAVAVADPHAAVRAALAAADVGAAEAALAQAGEVPGLQGRLLEARGDLAGACRLYAQDAAGAGPRAAGALLRVARCASAAGDMAGARAGFAEVLAGPLGDDIFVLDGARAAFATPPAAPLPASAWRAVALAAPAFQADAREALARVIAALVTQGGAAPAAPDQSTRAIVRLRNELFDTAAAKEWARGAGPAPALTLDDALARGRALDARHESAAVVALLGPFATDAAIKKNTGACEALLLVGKAERKLRHHAKSRAAFQRVAARCTDDIQKRAAYLDARVAGLSQDPASRATLERFLQKWPQDPFSDDVLLWLGAACGRAEDAWCATGAYRRIISDFPAGDMVHEARFRLAFLMARHGDAPAAAALLALAARDTSAPIDVVDRALYWRARLRVAPDLTRLDRLAPLTQEPVEDEGSQAAEQRAGLAELRALAQQRPASYYGHLARTVLRAVAPPALAAAASALPTSVAAPRAATGTVASVAVSPALGADPAVILANALVDGGYDDEAFVVLNTIAARAQQLPLPDALVIALLYSRAGDPGAGHALLRQNGHALLAGQPAADSVVAWSVDWPLAHADAIARGALEAKLPAALLMAIAREESAFDADVVSWAGAVGLCQLMPPTAADEARELKLSPPSVAALQDPALNARLGGAHLARRLRGLRHLFLAIAAYNAGPGAVLKWNPTGPADTWVESIPVDETRNYVKKVTGSFVTYSALDSSLDDVAFAAVLPARG